MTEEDHGEGDQEAYDPTSPTAPARTPPLRSTAPQSDYTMGQVGFGLVVLLIGLAIVFGLPIGLA